MSPRAAAVAGMQLRKLHHTEIHISLENPKFKLSIVIVQGDVVQALHLTNVGFHNQTYTAHELLTLMEINTGTDG